MNRQIPWLRVFVEGVVIVGSILLAFGIQAWWESAGEREREKRYLQSLGKEFAEAQAEIPEAEQNRAMALHAHEALIRQTQGDGQAAADSLLFWISLTSLPVAFDPPQAVFDDMVSSGGTQLIRSDSLRVALARYGTLLARVRAADDQAWATWEQRLQPFLEGRVPRVDRVREGLFGDLYDVPFGPSGYPTNFGALLGERVFQDMLAERWLRLHDASTSFDELSLELDGITKLIDSELGVGR